MNSRSKTSTLIQFAYKAKKICFGESVIIKMMTGKVKLMILAEDIAENQRKKYLEKANFYHIDVVYYESKKSLAELFSKNEVACVGIMDNNLAKEIKRISNENN